MDKLYSFSMKFIVMTLLFFSSAITTNQNIYKQHHEDLIFKQKLLALRIPKPMVKNVDITQQECLAKNIYFEARGESKQGQIAVARVVVNRIKAGFGKNPCSVVNQSTYVETTTNEGELEKVKVCQFSWVCDPQAIPNKNSPLYRQALTIAHDVLAYDAHTDILPGNALFFHSVIVNPGWNLHRVAKIGNHIFYSKGKQ